MREDQHFLDHAIRMGAQGMGRTWPNPSVGCVLVKDGQLLAAARSADGGRPHAETQALAIAGAAARGATAYVSLEPCAHHGGTPPCAQALIDAGIARVVIATTDPDPRVSGKGMAMLDDAGIAVTTLTSPTATHDLRGFFRRVTEGIPHTAMKLATSLDGRITDAQGASQWITGAPARAHTHRLRARFDAILTGIGTALADDPELTVRLPGLHHTHGVRIVCDRKLRLPLNSKLLRVIDVQPLWLVTSALAVEQAASHATDLREAGVILHVVEDEALAPATILRTLGAEGISRVLVEAGSTLSTAFWASGLVETLHWYRAPIVLGDGGKPAIAGLDTTLGDAQRLIPAAQMALGVDHYTCYESAPCLQD